MLHDGHGPAADWARDARPGCWVGVSEPGGRYQPDPGADFHVVIGDESALPAVATVLAALPAGVPATAFLEVADAAEEQPLPGAATVHWVHRGRPASRGAAGRRGAGGAVPGRAAARPGWPGSRRR